MRSVTHGDSRREEANSYMKSWLKDPENKKRWKEAQERYLSKPGVREGINRRRNIRNAVVRNLLGDRSIECAACGSKFASQRRGRPRKYCEHCLMGKAKKLSHRARGEARLPPRHVRQVRQRHGIRKHPVPAIQLDLDTRQDGADKGANDNDYGIRSVRGIGPAMAKRLEDAGITTMLELQTRPLWEIASIMRSSYGFAGHIRSNAHDKLVEYGRLPKITTSLADEPGNIDAISTGSKNFDTMLEGIDSTERAGIETGVLTGISGESGVGITQTMLKLAVMAQLPSDKGGLDTNVMVIDYEGNYRRSVARITEMAKSVGLENAHKRITSITPNNVYSQFTALDDMEKILLESKTRVILVDGAMAQFRIDYSQGSSGLQEMSQVLTHLLVRLKKMASIYDAAVVVNNQITASRGKSAYPELSRAGEILAQMAMYMVYIKADGPKSRVSMLNSPRHGHKEYDVWFTETGPSDEPPKHRPIHAEQRKERMLAMMSRRSR